MCADFKLYYLGNSFFSFLLGSPSSCSQQEHPVPLWPMLSELQCTLLRFIHTRFSDHCLQKLDSFLESIFNLVFFLCVFVYLLYGMFSITISPHTLFHLDSPITTLLLVPMSFLFYFFLA